MSQRGRNHAVDALKGLMILLIIMHHSQLLPFLHHGYLGVDVFFVIAGYYLMKHFTDKGGSAVQYSVSRIKQVYLPYLFAFLLACILDYKRLVSFDGFDGFVDTYAPFAAFLTLTEEMGFIFHGPVILVGGWFLSVLIVGGFLLYGLLEYNQRLTVKAILPFCLVLGFTYIFTQNPGVESFRVIGAISFPLLRGFLEMGLGVVLYSILGDLKLRPWVITLFTCIGLFLFVLMTVSVRPLDGYLVFVIPFMLMGVLLPESRIPEAYNRFPTHVLAYLGAMSLELYLIHQPVLHIVHSCFKLFGLPIRPLFVIPANLIAVILAAILLRLLCKLIRSKNKNKKCPA